MKTQMTGMSPKDTIGLMEVPLVNRENYPLEDSLPEDGLYHYLLQPGQEVVQSHLQIKRGRVESWKSRDVLPEDQPERAFVSEELMLIPEDTELPPDYVQKW